MPIPGLAGTSQNPQLILLRSSIPTFKGGVLVTVTTASSSVGRARGGGTSQSRTAIVTVIDFVPVLDLRESRLYVLKLRSIQLVHRLRRQQRIDLLLGFRNAVRGLRMSLESLGQRPGFVLLHAL